MRWIEERCEEVQEGLQHNNTRKAFELIKTLRKGSQPRGHNIKDAEGHILTDLQDILRRWRSYGEILYREDNVSNGDDDDTADPTAASNWPSILECEVEEAIKKLPRNKTAGYDEVPAELRANYTGKAQADYTGGR